MEKSKVISVRVPNDVLEDLEHISKESVYYNKSDVINAGLRFALAAYKKGEFPKLWRFYPKYGDVVDEITFKYHREVKR